VDGAVFFGTASSVMEIEILRIAEYTHIPKNKKKRKVRGERDYLVPEESYDACNFNF